MNTVSSAHRGSSSPSQKARKRARRPARKALNANTTATTAASSAQRTRAVRAERGVPGRGVEMLAVVIAPSSIVPREGRPVFRGKGPAAGAPGVGRRVKTTRRVRQALANAACLGEADWYATRRAYASEVI